MKCLAGNKWMAGASIPIKGVAKERMARVGKVDPNLVGSPSLKVTLDQGSERSKPFERGHTGDGRFALGDHCHLYALFRMAANRAGQG